MTELLPGQDGRVRLVQVDTARGQLLRPIQRLYPLECISQLPTEENRLHEEGNPTRKDVAGNMEVAEVDLPESASAVVAGVPNVPSGIKSRAIVSKVITTRSGRISKLPSRLR